MKINQYEIWIADLNPQIGTEAGKSRPVLIVQTNLLNKISQMFVNKKLVNSAKYGLNKIDLDLDELIYIVEIISSFLKTIEPTPVIPGLTV